MKSTKSLKKHKTSITTKSYGVILNNKTQDTKQLNTFDAKYVPTSATTTTATFPNTTTVPRTATKHMLAHHMTSPHSYNLAIALTVS